MTGLRREMENLGAQPLQICSRLRSHLLATGAMASDLEKKFKKAAWLIRNGPPQPNTSNDIKLKYYSLYKQATEGDAPDEGPGDMIGKFKHKSWLEKRGMSADAAMQAYIDLVASLE